VGYIENNLIPGETVLYKTRLHWIVLLWALVAGVFLAGAAFALLVGAYHAGAQSDSRAAMIIAGLLLLVAAAVFVAVGIVRRNSTDMAVSNKRVLIKTGFLARKSIEVLLSKVESIGVDESALGRILSYGSVIIRGTGGTFETFNRIAHPNEFRRQVQQQIGTVEAR
jgi:membrane protein YdbS with pleckstrin-like domain